MRIPVCIPTQAGKEKDYVADAIETNWIGSSGYYLDKFEEEFAKWIGVNNAITCTNGTSALHLALLALGFNKGAKILIPDFCIVSIPNAVIQAGLVPVVVDSELDTWNMDLDQVEKLLEADPEIKGIIAMHTYGCPIDMPRLMEISFKYHVPVIEDAAEAHGAEIKGRKVGSFGDIACFSFYANKIITTGEGGMVVTNNAELAERVKYYKNLCFKTPRFVHDHIGFNYRMTNVQAAIGCAQMEEADTFVQKRIQNAQTYYKHLHGVGDLELPPQMFKNVYWMFGILTNKKEELMTHLKKSGIETRSFFYPAHKQKAYKNVIEPIEGKNSTYLYEHGLYLPSSTNLTEYQIQSVCNSIRSFFK